MQTKVLALTLAVVTVGAVVGPAAAVTSAAEAGNTGLAVDVAQDDGVTVTVTDNGTGVENASVEVATVDENATYNGTDNYTTSPTGTVSLPSPTEHVEVSVTATVGDETATTTAILTAGENATYRNFGQSISSYIAIIDANSTDGPFGHLVASFAVENNPGNAPEHAGPPDNRTDGNETGPPEHAGKESDDDENGPPDHAGPPEDRTDDETDNNETDDGTDENDTDEDTDTDDDENGPPDHAGPPDDGENEDSDDNDGNGRAKGGN